MPTKVFLTPSHEPWDIFHTYELQLLVLVPVVLRGHSEAVKPKAADCFLPPSILLVPPLALLAEQYPLHYEGSSETFQPTYFESDIPRIVQ